VPYSTAGGKGAGVTAGAELVRGVDSGATVEPSAVAVTTGAPTDEPDAEAVTAGALEEAGAVAEGRGAELAAGHRSAVPSILPTTHDEASSVYNSK
jgi:hypothetical protein